MLMVNSKEKFNRSHQDIPACQSLGCVWPWFPSLGLILTSSCRLTSQPGPSPSLSPQWCSELELLEETTGSCSLGNQAKDIRKTSLCSKQNKNKQIKMKPWSFGLLLRTINIHWNLCFVFVPSKPCWLSGFTVFILDL